MESLLFPVLLVAVLVTVVVVLRLRPEQTKPRNSSPKPKPKRRKAAAVSRSPLQTLDDELRRARNARRRECDKIQAQVAASIAVGDRLEDGHVNGYVMLALDVWLGRDFTLRNRAVGLSWLPFVDPPEHRETDEIRNLRLDRVYRLDDEDKSAFKEMQEDPSGQFALVAGSICARVHAYPAWALSFFDERNVRIDLVSQVTAIASRSAVIREQMALLGQPPIGHLRNDSDITSVYIEKARVLDRRSEGLVKRLRALAEYRAVVAGIQEREEKRGWLDRVGGIDDFEHNIEGVVDHGESERIREAADDSKLLSELYLDTLTPLTASLTVSDISTKH